MEEKIVYSVEEYSDISENDCISYQNMYNSEYPTIEDRMSPDQAKERLLCVTDKMKIFIARLLLSEGSKLIGLIIVRQTKKREIYPLVFNGY